MFDITKTIADVRQVHETIQAERAELQKAKKEDGHLNVARGALESALEALVIHQRINPPAAS